MVPTVSSASNTVLVNGYYKETGWEITGLDWNTGKTVHRTIFGKDNFGNGAYAIVQFFPNGLPPTKRGNPPLRNKYFRNN